MKAFEIMPRAKVYVYGQTIRMNASFPLLSKLVQENIGEPPANGNLYIFLNSKLNYCKILFWSKTGPCIFAKTLVGSNKFNVELGSTNLTISGLENFLSPVKPKQITHKIK